MLNVVVYDYRKLQSIQQLLGSDELGNLALACRHCNERRYNFVAGVDPETQEIVPIFI